jgi:hypothetical protein
LKVKIIKKKKEQLYQNVTLKLFLKLKVDASQAGTGQLEIAVENGQIPCNFSSQGNLRFLPSFTAREAGGHEVTVKFNGYEVPGSPFICNIIDMKKLFLLPQPVSNNNDNNNVHNHSLAGANGLNGSLIFPIYKTNTLELDSTGLISNNINIKLTSPTGGQCLIAKAMTQENALKLSFQASEIGELKKT